VKTNDSDPDGDPLTVTPTPVVAPEHGTLILNPDGTFTYTPTPGYAGVDSFVYQVCDNKVPPLCDQGTVHIQVEPLPPPNHPPVAVDDTVKIQSGKSAEGNVRTNDSDPDGDPLVVTPTPVVAPAHGTLILNPDGTFTYTPAPGYAGVDSFVYQVCDNKEPPLCDQGTVHIQVEPLPPPPNHAPVAMDDTVKTRSGNPAQGNVKTNDSDPDGDPLTVSPTAVVGPEHGTLILNPDGTFTYTPTPGYAGVDSFVYQICDNKEPPLCDQGTVHIQVEPLPPPPNHAPIAMDDSVKTQSGKPAEGNVKTNDSDPDGDALTVSPTAVEGPKHGTLILNPDGTFTYTPAPGYAGADSFVYQVCDNKEPPLCDQGTVHITIIAPPVPIPYIVAAPTLVTVGYPVEVRVSVSQPVTAWDLWVYLADNEIDSTYGDAFVRETVLTPGAWFRIDPDYLPLKLTSTAKQEMLKFEIRILDQYGNRARAETNVMVHEANDLSLDRNTYEPDLQDPLQIRFRLSSSRTATLDLYDIAGRHISVLTDAVYPAGWTTYYWNGLTREGVRVGSGVYIVTLRSDEYKDWKKFMIVR